MMRFLKPTYEYRVERVQFRYGDHYRHLFRVLYGEDWSVGVRFSYYFYACLGLVLETFHPPDKNEYLRMVYTKN